MNKIKKYQKQIATFIAIILLLEFGIFPSLTAPSTAFNIVGAIGLLLLIVWGCLEAHDWANSITDESKDNSDKSKDNSEEV